MAARPGRSRLDALLHGASGHVDSLDDPQLATRLLELVEPAGAEAFRVLVVDDDAQSSRYLRLVLEQGGMQVRECADPGRCRRWWPKNPPDLLLLDLHMPEVDGLTLTMALRRQPELALLPILFISGEERENVAFQAIQAGADDFLCKPVRPRGAAGRGRQPHQACAHGPAGTCPPAAAGVAPPLGGKLRRGGSWRSWRASSGMPTAAAWC